MAKPIHPDPRLADLNDRAFRAGIRVVALLRRAHIRQSSWTRWRKGGSFISKTMDRLEQALQQMIEEDTDGEI